MDISLGLRNNAVGKGHSCYVDKFIIVLVDCIVYMCQTCCRILAILFIAIDILVGSSGICNDISD